MRKLLCVGVLAVIGGSSSCTSTSRAANSSEVTPCHVPAEAKLVSDFDGMPPTLRAAIKNKVGDIVSPNEPFEATDVVVPGHTRHNRRLLFAWVLGDRWVVATEHGGIGYNNPILAFNVNGDPPRAILVSEQISFPKSVCSTAEQLLH